MSFEIERRFRQFNPQTIHTKLSQLGVKPHSFIFNVTSFIPNKKGQMIRVRDEGHRVTFTIKQLKSGNNMFDREWEIIVNDYQKTIDMLLQLGYQIKYTTQKYRTIYDIPKYHAEVVFDYYPALPPYIEIEADSIQSLKNICQYLELNYNEKQGFSASHIYNELYGIPQNKISESITFRTASKILRQYVIKNGEQFDEILIQQLRNFVNKNMNKSTKKRITRKITRKITKKNK